MIVILLLVRSMGWIPSMTYVSPFDDLARQSRAVPAARARGRATAARRSSCGSPARPCWRCCARTTSARRGPRASAGALVVWRHALKNASLPVVTLIGIEFAFLIGGLIVTETVFNLPGVARYLVDAIQFRDYPIVQNLAMLIAVVVVFANLTVDLLYTWLDPRIKYGSA